MELTNLHAEKQLEREEIVSKGLKGLEKLFEDKSIDQSTYERLKKALENDYEANMEPDCSERDVTSTVT